MLRTVPTSGEDIRDAKINARGDIPEGCLALLCFADRLVDISDKPGERTQGNGGRT